MQKSNDPRNRKVISWLFQKYQRTVKKIKSSFNYLSIFFHWLFNIRLTLQFPVETSFERVEDELLGKAYYFPLQATEQSINNIMNGKVLRIFKQKAVLIAGPCNLQVIIAVNEADNDQNHQSEFSVAVKEGDQVRLGEKIFSVKKENSIKDIKVYIPWQPNLIKKIDGLNIYLRNPFIKTATRAHGIYL